MWPFFHILDEPPPLLMFYITCLCFFLLTGYALETVTEMFPLVVKAMCCMLCDSNIFPVMVQDNNQELCNKSAFFSLSQ